MPSETEKPFNPHSRDAMFATILERLKAQDGVLEEISAGVKTTNGRVTALEQWKAVLKAKVTLVAGGISSAIALAAWCIEQLRS